jgi:hypothetical protein
VHAQARDLDRPDPQAARPIPVRRLIARQQVFVGDDIGLGQPLRDCQPAAEAAHIGDHLLGSRVAL